MNRINPFSALILAGVLLFAGCDDGGITDPDNEGIPVPDAYVFESRFVDGAQSVNYGGQVVRNLLINDLKIRTDGLAKAGAAAITEEDLLRRYDYEDSYDLETLTVTGTAPLQESRYSAIATEKDLVGKIDGDRLIGWDKTADEVIRGYFEQIALNSQDPSKRGTAAVYTTEEGVDMSQMINKILLGAVAYSQATGTYLETVLDDANSAASGESPHSEMEHHWDEAFGYFGAARDFFAYSNDEVASGTTFKDSNGDGEIDLSSEYNFPWAAYARKRDAGTAVTACTDGSFCTDFSTRIFDAFLEGRTAIVNQASAAEIAEHRDVILETWEELVAANVVHYLNSTLSDLQSVTQAEIDEKNNEDLNEHWAEGKGFAFALQFNPFRAITDSQLEQLHALIGDVPPYALPGSEEAEAAAADLNAARDLLQSVYGFADPNMEAW